MTMIGASMGTTRGGAPIVPINLIGTFTKHALTCKKDN